jgi:hypothetical protein
VDRHRILLIREPRLGTEVVELRWSDRPESIVRSTSRVCEARRQRAFYFCSLPPIAPNEKKVSNFLLLRLTLASFCGRFGRLSCDRDKMYGPRAILELILAVLAVSCIAWLFWRALFR